MPIRLGMSLPQPLHLSAALTLVESKPKHLTIQGSSPLDLPSSSSDPLPAYIQRLRDSIENFHYHSKNLRRLNPSIFWQTQHDDLESKLEKERDAVFVLQKEKEALQAQVTELQARSKPGRKRKSAEQDEPKTVKKMKAGTIAIAEFGSAIDVDPGLASPLNVLQLALTVCSRQSYAPCPPSADPVQRPHVEHRLERTGLQSHSDYAIVESGN
jgi:hypothetical protein